LAAYASYSVGGYGGRWKRTRASWRERW
jgi:hypothetical protein